MNKQMEIFEEDNKYTKCSSVMMIKLKERRLIGKPPVSKTGTAGSIPAAPGLLGQHIGGEESEAVVSGQTVIRFLSLLGL